MVIQQQHRHPAQGGVDRRDLGEDVNAISVLVDQPLQPADLTLNPAQTQLQLVLVRRIAPHPRPSSCHTPLEYSRGGQDDRPDRPGNEGPLDPAPYPGRAPTVGVSPETGPIDRRWSR